MVEKEVPRVYCNDVEELVALVLQHRNQVPNDVDIKLGVDGGQGYLKVTLSITLKPEMKTHTVPEKKSRNGEGYSSQDFKDSSVQNTLILAILPSMNESFVNLKMILDKLKINSLDYTVSEDLKVLLQMVGKQTAASKHPCPFCKTSSPKMLKSEHYTLSSLCKLYDDWMVDGAKLGNAKEFSNVVHPPLLTGDPTKKIIEIVNIPGLHILLGVVDKLISEMEKKLFETKEEGFISISSFLGSINLNRVSYQGQHRLEGNACNLFLKKIESLEVSLVTSVTTSSNNNLYMNCYFVKKARRSLLSLKIEACPKKTARRKN